MPPRSAQAPTMSQYGRIITRSGHSLDSLKSSAASDMSAPVRAFTDSQVGSAGGLFSLQFDRLRFDNVEEASKAAGAVTPPRTPCAGHCHSGAAKPKISMNTTSSGNWGAAVITCARGQLCK